MRHRLPPELSGTAQTLTCLSSGVGALPATMPLPYSGATANCGRYATASNPFAVSHVIRDQRRRDMLASIAEWERASGPDRAWWRGQASWLIGQWRCLHQAPERAAFQAAVARQRT